MKQRFETMLVFFLVLLGVSASCAEEGVFTFRNGIQFGMTSDKIIETEKGNGQIDEADWLKSEMGNWTALTTNRRIEVSQYEAYLYYMLSNDHMQAAIYDFYGDTSKTPSVQYENMRYALSTVYGESETAPAAEIVNIMDSFVQGMYHEPNIVDAVKWQKNNVFIYQFFYGKDSFVILYLNPNYDYNSVNSSLVNVNGL
ncbi:MAG: hypothetical protein IKE24_01745 [Clostridia bacterium]|nr:hypothetical protein [Clostridia bacterium]